MTKLDLGTIASIDKFNQCKKVYMQDKSKANYKKLQKVYKQLVSDLRAEHRRKTITKEQLSNLLNEFLSFEENK